MAKKIKKSMTDNQFHQAIDELNQKQRPAFRGGKASIVIPNKKKEANKRVCRGKVDCQ